MDEENSNNNNLEKLNIYSPNFDPILALTSELPLETSISFPIYDNIAQWQRAVLHSQKRTSEITQRPSYQEMRTKKIKLAEERIKRYNTNNIDQPIDRLFYKRLHDIEKLGGPFSLLYNIWKSRGWVKVEIIDHPQKSHVEQHIYLDDASVQNNQKLLLQDYLNSTSISIDNSNHHKHSRGFLLGKLECFDKHMNLVLSNVLEGITNRHTLKNLGIIIHRSRRKPPKTKIQRDNLIYYRIWPMLFLQGNQVIHIQKISSS